ncbi:MAG: hypothetical protein LC685_05450 [Actinobacteria bacterium]|nr:hypothetical protein [Actinomycetota bacterium]
MGAGTARVARACVLGTATLIATVAIAVPAHAVATIAADTTRSLLRFRVSGLSGPPTRAVLRLRVTDPSIEGVEVRTLPSAFGEDDRTPALLLPAPNAVAKVAGVTAGTWAEWDVTKAVAGNGDVNLQVSGPLLDPASFSSREGPDAPQLVVTPDEPVAVKLAGLLDPRGAASFDANVEDDLRQSMDGLDVIPAPPALNPAIGYLGVYHSLTDGVFATHLATSVDMRHWTHVTALAQHASQATLATDPGGGFLAAFELDTPDPQYVSTSNLLIRHYADWSKLSAGQFDAEANIPRSLAPTNEGTPTIEVKRWGTGPSDSELQIRFHYFKSIVADRQARGTLTNFTTWAPVVETAINDLFVGLGNRGNLGDRADLWFEGHDFAVIEGQSIRHDFGSWRWYLYDRVSGEARLLAQRGPAGSFAFGNPTVRVLADPGGHATLFS